MSQDFRPGYIISLQQDSVKGFINYRNETFCVYKKNMESATETYSAEELYGFKFKDDKLFISKKIISSEGEETDQFLEVLVHGKLTLYKYKKRFFVEKETSFHELKNTKSILETDGVRKIRNKKEFIGIINYLTSDCDKQQFLPKYDPTEKIYTRIVTKYNQCIEDDYQVYKEQKPWLKSQIGIMGGVNFSTLYFKSHLTTNDYDFLTEDNFHSPGDFTIGILYILSSPRISEYISFHADLGYSDFEFINYYKTETIMDNFIYSNTFFNIKYLKGIAGLRYTLRPISPSSLYFSAGISVVKHLSMDSYRNVEYEINKVVTFNKEKGLVIKKMQSGKWAGIGLTKKLGKINVSGELRIEMLNGIAENEIYVDSEFNSYIINNSLLFYIYF